MSVMAKKKQTTRFFNEKLKALTENDSNLISYLVEGDQIQTSLYRKNDSENIHLNTLGREELTGMLQIVLKETVYRCEWQIRVK